MNKYITKVELPYIQKGSELHYDGERGAYYIDKDSSKSCAYQWYDKDIVEAKDSPFFAIHPDCEEEHGIHLAMAELGLKLDVDSMMKVAEFLKKYNHSVTKYLSNESAVDILKVVINKQPILLEAIVDSLSTSVYKYAMDKSTTPKYLDIKHEIREWFNSLKGKDIVINA